MGSDTSRRIKIITMVIVTDEPNGPLTRTSKINNTANNESIESIFTTDDSLKSMSESIFVIRNNDYQQQKYVLTLKKTNGDIWEIPNTYLDFNERLTECATREVEEECGIYIDPTTWQIFLPIDDLATIGDQKQNVTIRYTVNLTMDEFRKACEYGKIVKKHYKGENNEVEDVDLMLLTKENIESRKWAFNHRTLLEMHLGKTE